LWLAPTPTRRRQRLGALMSEAPIKSRVARKTRSALPVSAVALQAAVKVKANASSQAATITGGWPPTAKRVSHLFSLTGGVKWVPHVSRGSRRGDHRGRLQGIASRSQLSSVSDTVPAGSLRCDESPILKADESGLRMAENRDCHCRCCPRLQNRETWGTHCDFRSTTKRGIVGRRGPPAGQLVRRVVTVRIHAQ
jgi:hypothetical protein